MTMSSTPMATAEGGWISRKRKRPAKNVSASKGAAVAGSFSSATETPASPSRNDANDAPPSSFAAAAAGRYCIPVSLKPHLGWTNVPACHARPRKRRNYDWDKGEGVRRVAGRAVVSRLLLCLQYV